MEAELGIVPGFLEGLFKEDDWSFVIKTHALLEAALTHVVTVFVGEPRLERLFARLELSGATTGTRRMAGVNCSTCGATVITTTRQGSRLNFY